MLLSDHYDALLQSLWTQTWIYSHKTPPQRTITKLQGRIICWAVTHPEFGDVVELGGVPGEHLVCPLVVEPDVRRQNLIFLVLDKVLV